MSHPSTTLGSLVEPNLDEGSRGSPSPPLIGVSSRVHSDSAPETSPSPPPPPPPPPPFPDEANVDAACNQLRLVAGTGTNTRRRHSSIKAFIASPRQLHRAMSRDDKTRPMICDSETGQLLPRVLDYILAVGPVETIAWMYGRWTSDPRVREALCFHDRADLLAHSKMLSVRLCIKDDERVERTVPVNGNEFTRIHLVASAKSFACSSMRETMRQIEATLVAATQHEAWDTGAVMASLFAYGPGTVGSDLVDALFDQDEHEGTNPDSLQRQRRRFRWVEEFHQALCSLGGCTAYGGHLGAAFVAELLVRAPSSCHLLEFVSGWGRRAYEALDLHALACALAENGVAEATLSHVFQGMARATNAEAYAWIETNSLSGGWLHSTFFRSGLEGLSHPHDWGSVAALCDKGTDGRAPLVAIATLVEATATHRRRGWTTDTQRSSTPSGVLQLALSSLLGWIAQLVSLPRDHIFEYSSLQAVVQEISDWSTPLLKRLDQRDEQIIEGALRTIRGSVVSPLIHLAIARVLPSLTAYQSRPKRSFGCDNPSPEPLRAVSAKRPRAICLSAAALEQRVLTSPSPSPSPCAVGAHMHPTLVS